MWRDTLGINMDLRQVEWKVYLSATSHLDYDLARGDWIGDYDDAQHFPGHVFKRQTATTAPAGKMPATMRSSNEANEQTDLKQREKLFQQAETMLVRDELPIIPLYIYAGINYYHTNISGIYQNILDDHPLNYIKKSAIRD
jgi:oligopeptide transport system substrate-binding protein